MRACLGRTTLISLLVTSVQGPLRCQVLSRCHKDNDNQNHPCLPPIPTQDEQPSQDPELGLCWLCPLAGPSPSSPQEHFYLWIETLGRGFGWGAVVLCKQPGSYLPSPPGYQGPFKG